MARVVDKLPPSRTGSGTEYPWHDWLDGRVWELTVGQDFVCKPESMRSLASSYAIKFGRSVRTRVSDDKTLLFIQARPIPQSDGQRPKEA